MEIQLYNTKSRKKEIFLPIKAGEVGMYSCGPTVYQRAHIGNLRSYVMSDILKKVLVYNGYSVKHIINITDVGHLTSDEDEGEDKLEAEAKKVGESASSIAEQYTKLFLDDLKKLSIDSKGVEFPKATEHIKEQISFIEKLEKKGFTYKTSDGIYFDTKHFPAYKDFAHLNLEGQKEGIRVVANPEKKNSSDFALWKFSSSSEESRQQEWESPWGVGFPGWHIECSAMSMKYLGEHFDIHTGGIDHIPVHHTNEIAQSEALTGETFVNYWIHNEFIQVEGEKMAKSIGNTFNLDDLKDKNVSAREYRYWLLTAHYRTKTNFTWDAVEGSSTALSKLQNYVYEHRAEKGKVLEDFKQKFLGYINDDMDTPQAIALMWDLIKNESVSDADKKTTILDFDKVLGLGLESFEPAEIPEEVTDLAQKRDDARNDEDWTLADDLRDKIENMGYEVMDTDDGTNVRKS